MSLETFAFEKLEPCETATLRCYCYLLSSLNIYIMPQLIWISDARPVILCGGKISCYLILAKPELLDTTVKLLSALTCALCTLIY